MVGGSKASNLRHALFHKGYKRSSSFDFTFSLFFLSFSLSNSVRSLRLVRLRDKGHSRSSLTAKENVTFPFFFAQMYKISLYLRLFSILRSYTYMTSLTSKVSFSLTSIVSLVRYIFPFPSHARNGNIQTREVSNRFLSFSRERKK